MCDEKAETWSRQTIPFFHQCIQTLFSSWMTWQVTLISSLSPVFIQCWEGSQCIYKQSWYIVGFPSIIHLYTITCTMWGVLKFYTSQHKKFNHTKDTTSYAFKCQKNYNCLFFHSLLIIATFPSLLCFGQSESIIFIPSIITYSILHHSSNIFLLSFQNHIEMMMD